MDPTAPHDPHDDRLFLSAVVFLSCKLTDVPRRARDIINMYVGLTQEGHIPRVDDAYWEMRKALVGREAEVLSRVGFHVVFEDVFAWALVLLNSLEGTQAAWAAVEGGRRAVASAVFAAITDSFEIEGPIAPIERAAVAIHVCQENARLRLPVHAKSPVEVETEVVMGWWAQFGLPKDRIKDLAETMQAIQRATNVRTSKSGEKVILPDITS